MPNLLDTHTLIWFLSGDHSLSKNAKSLIEEDGATNFVSIVSLWEIAVKISLNKLELNRPYQELSNQIIWNGFNILPVTFEDTLIVSTLPFHHRDPFDRILIAQCVNNNLRLVSKDPHFHFYNIPVIW